MTSTTPEYPMNEDYKTAHLRAALVVVNQQLRLIKPEDWGEFINDLVANISGSFEEVAWQTFFLPNSKPCGKQGCLCHQRINQGLSLLGAFRTIHQQVAADKIRNQPAG